MSIECIKRIDNSCEIKQKLALEQESQENYHIAINYYLEALGRMEILCSSFNAYRELGPTLYIRYIETSLSLAELYKKENRLDKHDVIINRIESFIINLTSSIKANMLLTKSIKKT